LSLVVRQVHTRADWDAFYQAAHNCQGHDPHWVAPLRIMQADQLNPKKNPWFDHGEAAFFIALIDGRAVGRISAQVDHGHLKQRNDNTGFFGFFESIDDQAVADGLFQAAQDWLKTKGLSRALGPFSLNINEESGLLIDGFGCPPRMMMGHAQPYYQKLVEAAGYVKEVDMYAYLTPMDSALPFKQMTWLQRALDRDKRLSLRHLDPKRFEEDIATVVKIFNAAWVDNWNSLPMTQREVSHMANDLKPLLIPELVWFAEVSGQPAAMCMAFPDLNEIIKDMNGTLLPFNWAKLAWRLFTRRSFVSGTRVPLMGVMPEYKNKTTGSILGLLAMNAVRRESLRLRFPVSEMSWVLEGNSQTRHSLEDIGGRIYKTYRMYERAI
jgi:hypothetical protein